MDRVNDRYPWLWDTNDDNSEFERKLTGSGTLVSDSREDGFFPTDFRTSINLEEVPETYGGVPLRDIRRALVRLIEYAPEDELMRLLPTRGLIEFWPAICGQVRSKTCRAMMESLFRKLTQAR